MSGLSLGTRVSNLKSVALTFLELLAFNSHDRPLRTHKHTNTHIERTHYLCHSLRSLGGDKYMMHKSKIAPATSPLFCNPYLAKYTTTNIDATFFARDSIYAKARICYRNSVRLSVCLSVTRVIHAKTVEVRIIRFSPYSCPIPLVFAR